MKNKKVLLGLVLALVAPLLFLTACSRDDEPEIGQEPAQPVIEDEPDMTEGPVDEIIEIVFWHIMQGPHAEALDNLIENFHAEHPHIRVIAQSQGDQYNDLNQNVMAGAVAGNLPHMAQAVTDTVTQYMSEGIILPLNSFFNDPEIGLSQDEINDIVHLFREGVTWDGEMMSVPFGKSTRVLFYNIDLFEEYGVEVPTTWEELIEVAQILTDPDVNRFGMGFENGWGAEFIALTLQHGGEYIDEATATAHFGSPEGIAAAQFVMDMYEGEYVRFAGEDNFLSGVFGSGGVTMYIGSSAGLPHVMNAVDGNFQWSTAILPTYNGNAATRFQGNDIVLFDNGAPTAEQRAAFEFMAFTLRPEVTSQWAAESGYIPVRYEGRNHPSFVEFLEENPHVAAGSDQFDAGFITARVPGASQVWTILGEVLGDIRLGISSVEDALQEGQDRANDALEAANN